MNMFRTPAQPMRRRYDQAVSRWVVGWSLVVICLAMAVPRAARAQTADDVQPEVQFHRQFDPEFFVPEPVFHFPVEYESLWRNALRQSESELKREAALAIEQAHRAGYFDFTGLIPDLLHVFNDGLQPAATRRAAVRALIALDARRHADVLFEYARRASTVDVHLIEPTLAQWNHDGIRHVWLDRVAATRQPADYLQLAINGLGTVNESAAAGDLMKLVHNADLSASLRRLAAQSLAGIQPQGLEQAAMDLGINKAPRPLLDRLLAVTLLSRHDGSQAKDLLRQLAVDPDAAVAAVAWRRLIDVDVDRLLPLADAASHRAAPQLRLLAAETLLIRPNQNHIVRLLELLNDDHPDVRNSCRRHLQELAAQNTEFDEQIRTGGMSILDGDRWKELEQATLLLAMLDHKPAAMPLLNSLKHERAEVQVTAAWALRVLALPESLPGILDYAKVLTERFRNDTGQYEWLTVQAHLFEAFGVMEYREAEPLLREYAPREKFFLLETPRACAIWTLGRFHIDDPDPELTNMFIERFSDVASDPPEFEAVRQMCVIALGRMKAMDALPVLRKLGAVGDVPASPHIAWTITRLTGQQFPEPNLVIFGKTDWFLEPLRTSNPTFPPD